MKVAVFESSEYKKTFSVCIERMSSIIQDHSLNYYLSNKEKAELESIAFEKRRKEFVLGKQVSKKAISMLSVQNEFADISIEHGIFHQPIVKLGTNENIQISLSHCNKYIVAIAFNESFPCAIDIEAVVPKNGEIIHSQLTEDEKNFLVKFENEKAMMYTVLWTAKEAISKILKTGLTSELNLYEINEIQKEGKIFRGTFKNFYQYEFIARRYGDCICTIALPKNAGILRKDKLIQLNTWKDPLKFQERCHMEKNQDIEVVVLRMQRREMINYTYILMDSYQREAIIIDPAWEMDKIINTVSTYGVRVSSILLTHYHYDHTNLVEDLLDLYNCEVYIGLDEINYYNFKCRNLQPLFDGGSIPLGNDNIISIETPGHSRGSMCFLINNKLFTGDTLFMEGCGVCDMKGGNAADMYASIQKIKRYVDSNTLVYPGHCFLLPVGQKYDKVLENNIYLQLNDKERFVEFRMRKNQTQIRFK
ncbi:MBL fold metallo-hydrolase [Anaerocolumna xylanovorans]|uniref:Glyoxylase, beta-lactamase superfamily II n=1 Tax=Anaerocolumna xylanovorans DSM 12503 TaxID=1121345 RepID=A0A1M7XZK3_9FIRM|nr:MBL fold metallo-hydrolase [Anaerocolumna xylanovorans]SHO44493.1 Glyoxylase, beta-lactamase superfamily II [Anaerocolumna xylanovorans DSM 12503]